MKVDNQGERFFLRVRRDDYSDRDVAAFDRKSMVVDLIFYVYATWISMQEYMCKGSELTGGEVSFECGPVLWHPYADCALPSLPDHLLIRLGILRLWKGRSRLFEAQEVRVWLGIV